MRGHWSHDPEAYRRATVRKYSPRTMLAIFVLSPLAFWLAALLGLMLFK